MWWWILAWVLLVLTAVAVLALLGWRLTKQVFALGREFGTSAEIIGAGLDQIRPPDPAATSSVFLDAEAQPAVHPTSQGARRRRA